MGKSPSSQSLRGLDGLNFFMADGRDGLAPHLSADLMRGAGRFNLVQVLTALCVGIGAGLSNLVGGFIVQGFGYPAGFLGLVAIAVCGLVFFAAFMPETRPSEERCDRDPDRKAMTAGGAPT